MEKYFSYCVFIPSRPDQYRYTDWVLKNLIVYNWNNALVSGLVHYVQRECIIIMVINGVMYDWALINLCLWVVETCVKLTSGGRRSSGVTYEIRTALVWAPPPQTHATPPPNGTWTKNHGLWNLTHPYFFMLCISSILLLMLHRLLYVNRQHFFDKHNQV